MQYRTLGKSNINVSEIGFGSCAGGSWGPQSDNDSISALHRAIGLGVKFIDTAARYGNEKSKKIIAKVLKELRE